MANLAHSQPNTMACLVLAGLLSVTQAACSADKSPTTDTAQPGTAASRVAVEPSEPSTVASVPAAAPESAKPGADFVLHNGRVVTVDDKLGDLEAIAITGDRISQVGSNDEIKQHIGTNTAVIDLADRLVIPGFIEGHGHYLSFGRAQQILDLTDAKTWQDILAKVSAAVDQAQPGEWIFGRGWHQEKWQSLPPGSVEGVPTNQSLNAISGQNPVYLTHASGHAAFANSAALAAAGIDNSTADPAGGTIIRDANKLATGLLRENAQDLVEAAIATYDERLSSAQADLRLREQVALAGDAALRHGITSFHDAGASFETIDFYRILEAEGKLPVRLYVMVRGEDTRTLDKRLSEYLMPATGNDFLAVRSIKRQLDGALGAHGAWLLAPYSDLPDTEGLILESIRTLQRTAELAVKHGFQLNIHAIGDQANRETLDIYERAWSTMGNVNGAELRWRVEHAQHIDPLDVPRFGKLGVIAAVQGIHCTSDGPWIDQRLGAERTKLTSYPWRSLIDGGAILGNGTDVPVEPISAIASFYASVSRKTKSGERFHPEHVMTRREALASYTINNAYAAFEDDLKGSLVPGKLADLVVLSQDILTIAEDQIPTTQVDYTFLGGKLKYKRNAAR